MKRSLLLPGSGGSSSSSDDAFSCIPEELLQFLLVGGHHKVSQLSAVCKRWQRLLDNYGDWFSVATRNYREAAWFRETSPHKAKIDFIINTLASKEDQRVVKFRNYIGRQLNNKFRKLSHGGGGHTDAPILESIYAYVKEHAPNVLTLKNFHPRDIYLNFTEVGHSYSLVLPAPGTGKPTTYRSIKVDDNEHLPPHVLEVAIGYAFLSVTTFIHTLFPQFDAHAVITAMMASPKWHDPVANAYYGMTREEILAQWEEIGRIASEAGTAMHANIEMYYSERPYVNNTKEFKLFEQYEADYVTGKLRPYRTEWTIYSQRLQLCGSVDILYEYIDEVDHGDGKKHLIMGDWKRSKRINKYNTFANDKWGGGGCVPCTRSMSNVNYVHYSIQMPSYEELLLEYGVVIDAMALIVLHPNQTNYLFVPVERNYIKPLFKGIMDHRLSTLSHTVLTADHATQ